MSRWALRWCRLLTGERATPGNEGALELASWAISVTEPLSDFYTEVDLVEA